MGKPTTAPEPSERPGLAELAARKGLGHKGSMSGSQLPSLSENAPLGPLTSLGTGGSARWLCRAESVAELKGALAWASQRGLEVFVLGGGSNLVVADAGFGGLVIQVGLTGIRFDELGGDTVRVTAAAGENWDDLVQRCCAAGLSGIECLSGIPGTVGATPIQNVGAYGQDVAQSLVLVRCLDRSTGLACEFTAAECEFGYRDSRFKSRERERYVVLDATFELTRGAPASARYPELRTALESAGPDAASTAAGVRACVLQLRAAKSMLLNRADPNGRSCGSFFVNPVIDPDSFAELCARTAPDVPPSHAEPGGKLKVPAAWLIQKSGFSRGHRAGSVGLSTKHTLCLVAHEGATSSAVLDLARQIQSEVSQRCGIRLEPEPQLLGASF